MAWISHRNPWIEMTQTQFRCSLCWVMGLPCIPKDTKCDACGCTSDQHGVHFSKCTRLGVPARGHSFLKETFAQICREAGLHVQNEEALSKHPELIPADLLIGGLIPSGPMSLDFTEWSRQPGAADPLDRALGHKDQRYKAACSAEGWSYRVWAADTMGALHPEALTITKKVIKLLTQTERYSDDSNCGAKVWVAVTTAATLRTASQLARYSRPSLARAGTAADAADDDLLEALGVNETTLPDLHTESTDATANTAPARGQEMQTDSPGVGEGLPFRVLCRPAAPG